MASITTHLWFDHDMMSALATYVALIPGSEITESTSLASESPSGPPESVKVASFTLAGQRFSAMQAGAHHPFNDAVSIMVQLDTQDEIDRIWEGLLATGGRPVACGWLIDGWGLRWQIVPRRLMELMADPDRARAARAGDAMMTMVKLDIAAIEAAAG